MGTSKLSGKPDKMLRSTCDGLASHPGGVAIPRLLHATETGISSGSYVSQVRDLTPKTRPVTLTNGKGKCNSEVSWPTSPNS